MIEDTKEFAKFAQYFHSTRITEAKDFNGVIDFSIRHINAQERVACISFVKEILNNRNHSDHDIYVL